ncbi:MAG: SpoIIE family protein phosphatase [Gammaproteobacteria bacterium]|nr:SpoIIE family protein phosphatase [Gammaproteobacteria bacterium]
MSSSDHIQFLKRTELFENMPEPMLEMIDRHLVEVRVSAGETLFDEGDVGDAVYIIKEGELSLQSDGVHLITRRSGECVGEFALIDDEPRSAAAVAEADTVLFKWERESFQEMLLRDAEVARGIFRLLTGKLRQDVEQRVRLVAEQERWRQDIMRAREIQAGMLPQQDLVRPNLEIAGYCSPASEVGGDFYDYIEYGPEEVGVIIGDVTGHGFYSGLFVAMAKSCVHTQARVVHTPAEIMKSLRRALSLSIQRRLLMTCCYIVLDLARHVLTYANAGHPYPYLFTPASGKLKKLEALDPILGALEEDAQEFEERQMSWQPGDLLVLYSDGVSESRNMSGDMFEAAGLEQSICDCANASAMTTRDCILSALEKHAAGAPRSDDLTLVVARLGEVAA